MPSRDETGFEFGSARFEAGVRLYFTDSTAVFRMLLEISTLYLLATLVAGLLGALLLFFGRQEKIVALNWWGAAYLLGAAAVAIWTLLGATYGNAVSYVVGAFGILACGMIWNAARAFHGQRPTWLAVGLGIVIWLIASAVLPYSGVRLTIGATIVALFAGLASGELWTERRRAMHRRWPVLAVPILHGSVLLLPVLVGDIIVGDTPMAQSHWATVFAIELVLYAIGTVFVIFMMVSERTVSAHKVAAQTDPLTGLFNRRGFADSATAIMSRQALLGEPVSLLVFDVDRFKSINDRFGHPAGDEILKMFAATITHTLRTNDLSGRLGGEEFAALLKCSTADAAIAAERVREAFATSEIAIDDVPVETTVSVGVAGGSAGCDLATLLVAADAALYRAKANGRNRVELAPEIGGPSDDPANADVARKPNVVRRAPDMQQFQI
jgi:diguanylate cyclase (GGDEF)-like protein